jgi:hypothetical protein
LDQKLAQLLAQPRIGLSALKEYNEILAWFGLPSSNLPWSTQSDITTTTQAQCKNIDKNIGHQNEKLPKTIRGYPVNSVHRMTLQCCLGHKYATVTISR